MSLIEILVVAGLLLLIMTLVASFLLPGLRAYARSDARAQAQQNAFMTMSRIAHEVSFAHPSSVRGIAVPATDAASGKAGRRDGITFLSCTDPDGRILGDDGGDTLWQKRVVLYHAGDSLEVRQQEVFLSPAVSDPGPKVLDVGTYLPLPKDRVVARGIRWLQLDTGGPAVRIAVEAQVGPYLADLETTASAMATLAVPAGSSPSPGVAR